jgi:excisionase family DNA binding protein
MYELIASGKLRTVTLGRRRLIPVEALRELIESGST